MSAGGDGEVRRDTAQLAGMRRSSGRSSSATDRIRIHGVSTEGSGRFGCVGSEFVNSRKLRTIR